jgi:hypothetical protein
VFNLQTTISKGGISISFQGIQEFFANQTTIVTEYLNALSDSEKSAVFHDLGNFILTILYGFSQCEAMRDSNNNPCQKLPPAVLPQELVKLKYSQWKRDIFAPNKPRFSQFWNESELEQVETQMQDLLKDYNYSNPVLKKIVDQLGEKDSFEKCWSAIENFDGKIEESQVKVNPHSTYYYWLRMFSGSLACALPNTATVESDFSILKWEKDCHRSSLSDLSLEGIFQAKQRKSIPIVLERMRKEKGKEKAFK